MTRWFAPSLFLLSISACGMPTDAEEDTSSSEQAAGTTIGSRRRCDRCEGSHTGTYTIPVGANLAHAAQFRVGFSWTNFGDRVQLGYRLPLELTGTPNFVQADGEFDVRKNAFVLSDRIGTSECTVSGTRLRCIERLPNVVVDVEGAMRTIPATVDSEAHRHVVERFGQDPVGILETDLP